MVIIQRYATHGDSDRQWGNETYERIANSFKTAFPNHQVENLTINLEQLLFLCYSFQQIIRKNSFSFQFDNYCLACDIVDYSKADIIIGAHGAGTTIEKYSFSS
jgi:hypothetical protein